AADVEVGAGRDLGDLPDHVRHELVGDLVVHAQPTEADAGTGVEGLVLPPRDEAVRRQVVRPARVQLRIRDLGGVRVSGHIDLGDDDDVVLSGVLDDLGVVLLGEVPAGAATDLGGPADLREIGPAVDLDPPALVV